MDPCFKLRLQRILSDKQNGMIGIFHSKQKHLASKYKVRDYKGVFMVYFQWAGRGES